MATAPEGRAADRPHPEAVSSPPDEQGEQGDDHRADGDALPEVCVVGVQTTKRLADLCDVSLDHACVHARHHSARITHPHARVPMRPPRLCPCACARASPLPVPTRGGRGVPLPLPVPVPVTRRCYGLPTGYWSSSPCSHRKALALLSS